jgi:hypothetical protein
MWIVDAMFILESPSAPGPAVARARCPHYAGRPVLHKQFSGNGRGGLLPRDIRDACQDLSAGEDYRCMFDPYWVRAEPYRVSIRAGQTAEVTLRVRNFLSRPQEHCIRVCSPQGATVAPALLEGTVAPQARGCLLLKVSAPAGAKPGAYTVAVDVTRDGQRYGPWFDLIVSVAP